MEATSLPTNHIEVERFDLGVGGGRCPPITMETGVATAELKSVADPIEVFLGDGPGQAEPCCPHRPHPA